MSWLEVDLDEGVGEPPPQLGVEPPPLHEAHFRRPLTCPRLHVVNATAPFRGTAAGMHLWIGGMRFSLDPQKGGTPNRNRSKNSCIQNNTGAEILAWEDWLGNRLANKRGEKSKKRMKSTKKKRYAKHTLTKTKKTKAMARM